MTRPTRWKTYYVVAFLALGGVSYSIISALDFSGPAIVLVVVVLLIPGRINGYFYRDFHTGVRLMTAKRYDEALVNFRRFLAKVKQTPTLKRVIWFAWGIYTRDIEAMTLNNMGAISLEKGELGAAAEQLRQSLDIDPDYPIPFYNLAVVAEVRGDRAAAEELLAAAVERGYRRTNIDKVVHHAGIILATLESRKIDAAGAV